MLTCTLGPEEEEEIRAYVAGPQPEARDEP